MTDDLITRLTAAIDHEEQLARAATPGPWITDTTSNDGGVGVLIKQHNEDGPEEHVIYSAWADEGDADCEHVARWNPARVLRHCAADREIVQECEYYMERTPYSPVAARLASLVLDRLARDYGIQP